MELLYALLLGIGGLIATAWALLFSCAVYYDLSKTRMPPGLGQPLKLRIVHWALIMTCMLGLTLEFVGLCNTLVFIRFVLNLRKTKLDPSLFSKDLHFDGVPVRVYQSKTPSAGLRKGFVFFHGGAGMVGSIDLYDSVCNKITKECDVVCVSVGYRLSPEHIYPAQYKDCLAATLHFMQNAESYGVDPSQIAIGGDSAGGNFASVVAQKLVERSDLPKLRAQILIYPGTQAMDFNLPSYQQNGGVPILYKENIIYFALHYNGLDPSLQDHVEKGSHVPDDMRRKYGKWVSPDNIPEKFKRCGYKPTPLAPYKPEVYRQCVALLETTFSSLFADDAIIRQLPETLIVSCEYDVLRDDALLYKKRLEDQGVKVSWFHAKHSFHGVVNFFDSGIFTFLTAVEIMDKTVAFINHL